MKVVSEWVMIRIVFGLLLITALSGCSLAPWTNSSRSESANTDAERQSDSASELSLPLPELMLKRLQLCLIPEDERLKLLDDYRAVFVEGRVQPDSLPSFLPESTHQLNALMLASCDPGRTPGVLSEMLAAVTSEEHWSAEYMAFFDVLVASHRAYALVDGRRHELKKKYEDLQTEHKTLQSDYRALQIEHENTIKGISDIERSIDLPDGKRH